MDYGAPLDLYCERIGPAFWAEPLNALSNVAFVVAAVLLHGRGRASGRPMPWDVALAAVLIALVGIGSFVFHTVATVWAGWLDVLFIELYIYFYLTRFLARAAGLRWLGILAALIGYALFERRLTGLFAPDSLNGSYRYLPALIALAGMAAYAWRARLPVAALLSAATLTLCVSLALRTIDMALCEFNPLGTHFLWHALNAVMLYCTAIALPRLRRDDRPATAGRAARYNRSP